jgi:hypothetical protein
MCRNWTINRQLFTAIGTLLALILAAGVVATWSSARLRHGGAATVQAAEMLHLADQLEQINAEIVAAEGSMILASVLDDRPMLDDWTRRIQEFIEEGERRSGEIAARLAGTEHHAAAQQLQKNMANGPRAATAAMRWPAS